MGGVSYFFSVISVYSVVNSWMPRTEAGHDA